MNKIIQIELNELCPKLLEKWMNSGDLPNFKRLYDVSDVFTTLADGPDSTTLEPWIQWYSIHTGLPFSEHKVFQLTDGPRAGHKDIWSLLHDGGKKVWNCSSMNARQFSHVGSAYLPDPWCTSETPFPSELGIFHEFVGHQVREYSNNAKGMGYKDVFNFLKFMLGHGLKASTVFAIVMQFVSEFRSSGKTRWKRVVLQDRLLFDVFSSYFKKLQPDFSTFFANSTAHLQHAHWRHMEPEKFTVPSSEEDLDQYRDAIKFGYKKMDELIGNMMKIAGSDTRLIFTSGLSQQPYLKHEDRGGHHFYRPHNIERLFDQLGLKASSLQPVMTHQFLAKFDTATDTENAKKIISSLTVDGKILFGFGEGEPNSLYFGSQIHTNVLPICKVESQILPGFEVDFFDLLYKIEGLKSGFHHPDGCLWIQTGQHQTHTDKVSVIDIFPTVAKLLQVPTNSSPGKALI